MPQGHHPRRENDPNRDVSRTRFTPTEIAVGTGLSAGAAALGYKLANYGMYGFKSWANEPDGALKNVGHTADALAVAGGTGLAAAGALGLATVGKSAIDDVKARKAAKAERKATQESALRGITEGY